MDHHLHPSDLEHNHLEEVAGAAGSCEEEARQVVELYLGDRVRDSVLNILVCHPVAPCGPADLHTE